MEHALKPTWTGPCTAQLMKTLPNQRARWLTKHSVNKRGVDVCMKRYKRRLTATCPLCPSDEDASHVWLFQSAQTQQQWSAALSDLRFWLEEQGTEPGLLMDLLVLGLDSWRTQGTPPSAPNETLALRQAFKLSIDKLFKCLPHQRTKRTDATR